jgi:hypothetical protein
MPHPVEQFVSRIRQLRLDRSKGVAKPYKPLLVAAVVLLIAKGKLRSPDITPRLTVTCSGCAPISRLRSGSTSSRRRMAVPSEPSGAGRGDA